MGFSDRRIAASARRDGERRAPRGAPSSACAPVYKTVDTCGAEFAAYTPYLYSTYEGEDESAALGAKGKRKIMILGGGPNRIGQGIEFDYCCVHAAFALREDGFETMMVNCNPETVSTDYDTSDKLFFEPLTLEDVLEIVHREQPEGVIVQFGGQTPLKLAVPLEQAGVKILGTSPDSIDRAEDRERFAEVLDQARAAAAGERHGALGERGGRASPSASATRCSCGPPTCSAAAPWRSSTSGTTSSATCAKRVRVVSRASGADRRVPRRRHRGRRRRRRATARDVVVGGIMEHIERAGVHSGDSACSLPPKSIPKAVQDEIRRQTVALARELGVVGLMNVQFAVKKSVVYILEVNPRASRTVPFVVEGDRPAARQDRRARHGRPDAARARRDRGDRAAPRERQGSGVPVPQVPRRRHPARPRDEIDRRGDGHRRLVRACRSPRRRSAPAPCCRSPARCSCRCSTPTSRPRWRSAGASPNVDSAWWRRPVRRRVGSSRAGGGAHQQGARGRPAQRRRAQPRRDRHGDQHARGRGSLDGLIQRSAARRSSARCRTSRRSPGPRRRRRGSRCCSGASSRCGRCRTTIPRRAEHTPLL